VDTVIIAALIAAVSAIITGALALRATRAQEQTKQLQVEHQNELDSVKLRVEAWSELVDNLRQETIRKEKELEIERGKNVALQETIDYLRERLTK